MKIKTDKVIEYVNNEYYGRWSRFSRDVGIQNSHVHHAIKDGIGGGKKLIGALIKYFKEKGLNYEDYIDINIQEVPYMSVECIENKCENTNFTLGKIYEIFNNGKSITCDFIKLNLPKDFVIADVFEFVMCKFRIIK